MSMKHLIPLLAFSFLIGCDGEKSNTAPSKDSPKEAASETKTPEAVSVNPNLKYEIQGDAVTITGCAEDASGELIIPAIIEGKPVTSVGTKAFYDCISLKSITIPDSVTSIGDRAFGGCTSMTKIEVGVENVNYANVSGVLFNKDKTLLHAYPAGKAGANYVIPDSVNSIGNSAFDNCTSLKSITIPDSVTSIGEVAFYNSKSLTSITIGNGVTSIGHGAFISCTSLTSITFPDSVTSIGNSAFDNCTSLKSITIGNGITSIGVQAFRKCTSLTSITIPDSIKSIGVQAFRNCTSLTAITFLGDAPKIADPVPQYRFRRRESITFLGGAPKIANDAFKESSPTIYREADAKGWGDRLAGRPVKLITEKP
jgi:hypothetical protein